jgi:hypothetical protein
MSRKPIPPTIKWIPKNILMALLLTISSYLFYFISTYEPKIALNYMDNLNAKDKLNLYGYNMSQYQIV